MMVSNRYLLFQGEIFRYYVSFGEGSCAINLGSNWLLIWLAPSREWGNKAPTGAILPPEPSHLFIGFIGWKFRTWLFPCTYTYMDVSENSGTQKHPKWSFLVGKPMVVGYHHFGKPPYIPEHSCTVHFLGVKYYVKFLHFDICAGA